MRNYGKYIDIIIIIIICHSLIFRRTNAYPYEKKQIYCVKFIGVTGSIALLVVLCATRRLGTSEYRGLFHCLKRIHVNTKVQFCFVCPEDLNHLQVFSLYAFLILLDDPFWNF